MASRRWLRPAPKGTPKYGIAKRDAAIRVALADPAAQDGEYADGTSSRDAVPVQLKYRSYAASPMRCSAQGATPALTTRLI
jgi:hypothetical protein